MAWREEHATRRIAAEASGRCDAWVDSGGTEEKEELRLRPIARDASDSFSSGENHSLPVEFSSAARSPGTRWFGRVDGVPWRTPTSSSFFSTFVEAASPTELLSTSEGGYVFHFIGKKEPAA